MPTESDEPPILGVFIFKSIRAFLLIPLILDTNLIQVKYVRGMCVIVWYGMSVLKGVILLEYTCNEWANQIGQNEVIYQIATS